MPALSPVPTAGALAESQVEVEFSLENGLKVYLLPYSGSSLAAIVLAVRVGTADESPESNGLLHLLEHCLLFRQAHLTADNKLFRTINKYGLYYNGLTEQDLMFFEICLPREHLEAGLGLLKEAVFSFNLTEEALEQEKSVLLKELAENSRRPEKVGLAKVYELAFPGTGYALPVYGREEVIRKATLESLNDWHQKYFQTGNAALAVVGDFGSVQLKESLKNVFSDLKGEAGQPRGPRRALKSTASGSLVEFRMKVSNTYVMAGLPGPEYNSPDRIPMDMLSELADQGLSPLIYQAFAGQPELVSSAHFHYLSHEQTGLVFISVTSSEESVPTIRRLLQKFLPVLAEMNYSRDDYLPDQQFLVFDFLQGGKKRFQGLSEKMTESPLLLALSLAKHLLLRDDQQQKNYLEAINNLGSSDLRKAARRYLARARPVWVVIKPEKK